MAKKKNIFTVLIFVFVISVSFGVSAVPASKDSTKNVAGEVIEKDTHKITVLPAIAANTTNSTSTSTSAPTTTTDSPQNTTPSNSSHSTNLPLPTPPKPDRSFDLPSFVGGVILALGVLAIGYVVYKFYRARTDPNYRIL